MNIEQRFRQILKGQSSEAVDLFIEFCREHDTMDIDLLKEEKDFGVYYKRADSDDISTLDGLGKQMIQLQTALEELNDPNLITNEIEILKEPLATAIKSIGIALLPNNMMKTKGSPTRLSYGEIRALLRLKIIYYNCFPGKSTSYNNPTLLRSLGEEMLGKSFSKKVDRLINRQQILLEMSLGFTDLPDNN